MIRKTKRQHHLLSLLYNFQPLSAEQITEYAGINCSASAVLHSMRRLLEAELVEVFPVKLKGTRSRSFQLTDAGLRAALPFKDYYKKFI